MKRNVTKKIAYVGLMAAVIAVLSQISIPFPSGVPITLQTFAVAIAGYFLGYKYGTAAVCTYILLGVVGVPVFSGFKGGINVLFSVTGGFIWGFLPFVFLCGLAFEKKSVWAILSGLLGMAVCHAMGTAQFSVIGKISFFAAFIRVSLPYLIKDVVSVVAAYFISRKIRKRKKPV